MMGACDNPLEDPEKAVEVCTWLISQDEGNLATARLPPELKVAGWLSLRLEHPRT